MTPYLRLIQNQSIRHIQKRFSYNVINQFNTLTKFQQSDKFNLTQIDQTQDLTTEYTNIMTEEEENKLLLQLKQNKESEKLSEEAIKDLYKELSSPLKQISIESSSNKVQNLIERLKTQDTNLVQSNQIDFVNELVDSGSKAQQISLKYLNELLYVNTFGGRLPQALEVVQLMQELGFQPNERTYCYLMKAYTIEKNLPKAIEAFKAIGEAKIDYSIYSYNNLMVAYIENHRISDALDVFYKLRSSNVRPELLTFNLLIRGCNNAKMYKKSWELFDYMRLEICQPDVVLYSQMIKACVINEETERALDLYQEMLDSNILPTQITFNTLISACAARSDYYQEAFRITKQMIQDYGYKPDKYTYTALLYAAMKCKDLDRTRKILLKIFESDDVELKNNPILLSIAILSYSATVRPSKLTVSQIKSRLNRSEIPSNTSSTDLTVSDLSELLKNERPSKLSDKTAEVELLFSRAIELLSQKGTSDNLHHLLNSYLTFYTNANNLTKSSEIFEQISSKYHLEPNGFEYSLMLQILLRYREEDRALQLWKEFEGWYGNQLDHVKDSSKSETIHHLKSVGAMNSQIYELYTDMINGMARCLRLDIAFDLLIQIQKQDKFRPKLKLKDFKTLYFKIYEHGDQEMMLKLYELVPSNSHSLEKSKFKLLNKWKGKISSHQQVQSKHLPWDKTEEERKQLLDDN